MLACAECLQREAVKPKLTLEGRIKVGMPWIKLLLPKYKSRALSVVL